MGNSCYFIEMRPVVFTCILINTLFCNIVYKSVNIAFDITHCRANKFVHRYSWRRQYSSCIAERSLGKSYSSFVNEFWYQRAIAFLTFSLRLFPLLSFPLFLTLRTLLLPFHFGMVHWSFVIRFVHYKVCLWSFWLLGIGFMTQTVGTLYKCVESFMILALAYMYRLLLY